MAPALIALMGVVDGPHLARAVAALRECSTWDGDIAAEAARLDEQSRAHEAAAIDSVAALVASVIGGAAICFRSLTLEDERELLATTTAQLVAEIALGAAIATRHGTIREQTERLLASPA